MRTKEKGRLMMKKISTVMQLKWAVVPLFMVLAGLLILADETFAASRTFPKGSYIVPMDSCWQPNNDPQMIAQGAGCDTHKNDQSIFQAYGLIYNFLKKGLPVYWIIDPAKADSQGIDLSLTKPAPVPPATTTDPAVTIYHSTALSSSGAQTTVSYRGGPFIIDANDINSEILTFFESYPAVKLHKANYDFSAEVDKVLSGTPPKIAVLGEGSVQVLTDYLKASGLGNQLFFVFDYLTSQQIIDGALSNYQLLWAPHWEIDKEVTTASKRPQVISAIRSFIEAGNAGFFECASIESLERAYDVSKNSTAPSSYYAGQGFLMNKYKYVDAGTTPFDTKGLIESNGGTQDVTKMVFERPNDILTQCGGWKYQATGGHVHNLRPSQQPNPDYTYNTTVTRFIHDSDDQAVTGYPPKGFDYYVGGRINGSATQGYVSYLAGHKYIKCTDTGVSVPADRLYEIEFNASLDTPTVIYVEALHSGCTMGSTCPKATFTVLGQTGTYSDDGSVYVDLDSATFEQGIADPSKFYLKNIFIGNRSTTAKTITGLIVTFSGNPVTTVVTNINEVTSSPSTTVCSPNSPSPAACPSIISKTYDLTFDAALVATTTVQFEAVYSGCTAGTDCPKASFDLATNLGTTVDDGTIRVDMSGVTYDAANKKIKGIKIANLSGSAKTVTQFKTYFAGNGATKLATIEDVTTTVSTVCSPNVISVADCNPNVTTADPKEFTFSFKNNDLTGTITVEAVHAGCIYNSTCPKATIAVNNSSKNSSDSGVAGTRDNASVKIDMSSANYGNKKLSGVYFTSKTGGTVTITRLYVTFTSARGLTDITAGGSSVWSSGGNGTNSVANADITDTNLTVTTAAPSLNISLAASPSPLSIALGAGVSGCTIDWGSANTCGIKYVLNTLFGLQFQIVPNEYVKAAPVVKDNVLYKGVFEFPGYKGHLYAIDVRSNPAVTLWDAGKNTIMPYAGIGNPATPSRTASNRYIFTNYPGETTKRNFDAANYLGLHPYLYPGVSPSPSIEETKALINSVRGRYGTSVTDYNGLREISKRLGGIEHSTPAVMTKSTLIDDATTYPEAEIRHRDKIVFVGAHDGMLHAFYAGSWDPSLNSGKGGYANNGTGREIWAYIPSALLSSLRNQTFTDCNPFDDPTDTCPVFTYSVSVDSSPALGDFFVDHDNNPSTPKQWRTILVATAMISNPGDTASSVNMGIIFALDVTNPYDPKILWERTYNSAVTSPGSITKNYYPSASFPALYKASELLSFDPNMGNSKGVAIGRVQIGSSLDTMVFLTSKWVRQVDINTNPLDPPHNVWGLSVFGLDFFTGDIKWETKIMYTGDAEGVNDTPAIPVLMDYGNNGTDDYVVFGDMQGRLWMLKAVDGTSKTGDTPAFVVPYQDGTGMVDPDGDGVVVPAGAQEPIGAMVAVYKNYVTFGTGGRDSLANESTYKFRVFTIQLTGDGIRNVWQRTATEITEGKKEWFELQAGEKVWAQPLIDAYGNVYIGTAIGYVDVGRPDEVKNNSSGRLVEVGLKSGSQTAAVDLGAGGAIVGGLAIENNHISILTFDGKFIQIGDESFTSNAVTENPIKSLWWRTLQ
ncbi:MAG: hypothetical protein OHK006_09520 [Thermodesulfovibrionales bacterium]